MIRKFAGGAFDQPETAVRGSQGELRFKKPDLRLKRRVLLLRHIRQIRSDQIEAFPRQFRKEIRLQEAHFTAAADAIAPRNLQRVGADVHRRNPHVGAFRRNRQRDRSRTGAEIQHRTALRQMFDRIFRQQFRLRARNQHGRRHLKFQIHEIGDAEQILQRFAVRAAAGQLPDMPLQLRRNRFPGAQKKFRPRNPGQLRNQKIAVHRRRSDSGIGEHPDQFAAQFRIGNHSCGIPPLLSFFII